LLLLVFPAIDGLALNETAAVAAGFLTVGFKAPVRGLKLGLGALFLGGWRRARPAAQGAAGRFGAL
jgi:hypothetical protein